MMLPLERITLLCFGASYGVALGTELLQLTRPRAVQRWTGVGFGVAGLFAHTLYLFIQRPSLSSQFGSLVFLAWILAVFYLYGTVHHARLAWGIFVLPLVLGLVVLAPFFGPSPHEPTWLERLVAFEGEALWGVVHGALLLLAAVGVCVAFLASIMYLFQSRRLRTKALPGEGLQLLSLERLELMHRRAINLAFPLLTGGMLTGIGLTLQHGNRFTGWTDPKVVSSLVLWLVFAILLYLRYGYHLRGRRVAVLTIVAFFLLLITWALPTHAGAGVGP